MAEKGEITLTPTRMTLIATVTGGAMALIMFGLGIGKIITTQDDTTAAVAGLASKVASLEGVMQDRMLGLAGVYVTKTELNVVVQRFENWLNNTRERAINLHELVKALEADKYRNGK